MRLPKRPSLVTETAEVLREGIAAGEWPARLPGERTLCERLQVSRTTLREALQLLERRQLISAGAGRPRRVRRRAAPAPHAPSREIGLLSLLPVAQQTPQTIYHLHELREQLQTAGFRLRIFSDRRLARPHPSKFLQALVEGNRIDAWLLLSMSAAVQQWFAQRRLPTLVVGYAHAGVRLPSFDVDLRAACRHAASQLRAQGHAHLALLRQPQKGAGMTASEDGFLEAARLPGRLPCQAQILGHDGSPAGIRLSLDRALASARPPTGLVVCDASHALCAASHLLARRLAVPGDLSVLCRDHDVALDYFHPAITRYAYRKHLYARRVARLAIQLATHGRVPQRSYRLLPQLVPGQTLAPPRAAG
ncbi:MAG: GntR family transcriptional regulator [Opitutaceae bacterium]|nr:GntR family transcriptional regulator [Opitutaceae bacterium]